MSKNFQFVIILEIWNEQKMEFVFSVRDHRIISANDLIWWIFDPFLASRTENMYLEMRNSIYKQFQKLLKNTLLENREIADLSMPH